MSRISGGDGEVGDRNSNNTGNFGIEVNNWSERSACAALGCRQKRSWPL